MSVKEFREGISRFKDVQDGPGLRKRVLELEEKDKEKDRQIEKIYLDHGREVNSLHNTIATHENQIRFLEASNEDLESIRVSIGGKEKVSLRKFAQLVTSEAKKANQETIVSKANEIAMIKLPIFVEAEIDRYPYNCTDETRSIIESKAFSLRDEYLEDPGMWSPEFRSKNEKVIKRRVEEDKNASFWQEVHIEANKEINQRLPSSWTYYLQNFATKYIQNSFQNQLRRLSIPITLYCPKCHGPHQVTLTPNELAQIIRHGFVSFPCMYCKWLFKPKVSITLGELFMFILNGDVTPQKIPEPIRILNVRVVNPNTEKNSSPS